MYAYFAELMRAHELLYVFAWRDAKITYRRSVIGCLWAIPMPVFIVAGGVMVSFALTRVSVIALDSTPAASGSGVARLARGR